MHPRSATSRLLAVLEGAGWLLGYLVSQGLVAALLFALLLGVAFGVHWPAPGDAIDFLLDLKLESSFLLIGVSTLGSLFLLIPAVWLRLGQQARTQLGLTPLRRDQFVFALAMVIPVGIVGNAVHQFVEPWWGGVLTQLGFYGVMTESALHTLHRTFQGVPYSILVVAVALGPAIGEEFVFRGVVGRRMIAAWGIPAGIALTSILFALAHLSPPHALATIPIAIVAHLLYLHCGSLWAPILLHFGNNLLAVSSVRFDLIPDVTVSFELLAAAMAYLGLLALAWHANERLLSKQLGIR